MVYFGGEIIHRRFFSLYYLSHTSKIGNYIFADCETLTSLYCKAITPPALGGSWVRGYNASDRKIYVPAESVEAYKTADGWSEYAADIVGYDF